MIFCVTTIENGQSLGTMGFDCAISAMEHVSNMQGMGREVQTYAVAKIN